MQPLNVGFMRLVDAAPLIAAEAFGFAAGEGLELKLVRETSWANIRDRVAVGHFDAAQMLAPMPLAATLGLGCAPTPTIAPFALCRRRRDHIFDYARRRDGRADRGGGPAEQAKNM